MGRPRQHGERVTTAIRFPVALHDRLTAAADERELPVNLLVVRAVEKYLERLVAVDELLGEAALTPALFGRKDPPDDQAST